MALTLVEAAKLYGGDPLRSAIIELYARSVDILRVLPFEDIQGSAMRYNREQTLPGIGFRGVNEAYVESTGILNPVTEPLVIAGGDLDVDNFILDTMGQNQRAVQEAMKVKSLALSWAAKFITGSQAFDPREFDGLRVRLVGDQLLTNSAAPGGAALSLANLDALIDAVVEPQYLCMNKTMRRRLSQAARNAAVGGYITYELDAFGRKVTKYNDLEILIFDEDNTGAQVLPFTEAPSGGGANVSTSIYCIGVGEGLLTGIQRGSMDVRDLGELQTTSAKRTRVEWYNGLAVYHGKAAARLRSIIDAAIVA